MRFGTPHGCAPLPPAVDLVFVRLPRAVPRAVGAVRRRAARVCAKVEARTRRRRAHRPRRRSRAELVVDALGWRRVLDRDGYQPPDAPLSRGLEVHPDSADRPRPRRVGRPVDRPRGLRLAASRPPASNGSASGPTRRATTSRSPRGTSRSALRDGARALPGQLVPAPAPRRRGRADVFFAGDAAGHCLPLSGEGIRTAFHFGDRVRCASCAGCSTGGSRAELARERYAAFSASHARAYARLLRAQRLVPRVPPRLLALALRIGAHPAIVRRVFTWYLDVAPPPVAERQPRPSSRDRSRSRALRAGRRAARRPRRKPSSTRARPVRRASSGSGAPGPRRRRDGPRGPGPPVAGGGSAGTPRRRDPRREAERMEKAETTDADGARPTRCLAPPSCSRTPADHARPPRPRVRARPRPAGAASLPMCRHLVTADDVENGELPTPEPFLAGGRLRLAPERSVALEECLGRRRLPRAPGASGSSRSARRRTRRRAPGANTSPMTSPRCSRRGTA